MIKPNLTGKALIAWMVKNKLELIDAKKAAVKYSDPLLYRHKEFTKDMETADKKAPYTYENDAETGILKRTVIANTYFYMDSHDDVHLENIFANSIKQKENRPAPHLHDHEFSIMAKVGKALKYHESQISWRELGLGKTGMTMALFLETEIKKALNDKVYEGYLNDEIDQHSVSMRYIKIALAVNDAEGYPNEYEEWNKWIAKIGNRSEVENQGYFWAIYEAALFETSAVLEGSNGLTPTLGSKSQPLEDIVDEPKVEPHKALNAGEILKNYLN
jgi:hypothetical protein